MGRLRRSFGLDLQMSSNAEFDGSEDKIFTLEKVEKDDSQLLSDELPMTDAFLDDLFELYKEQEVKTLKRKFRTYGQVGSSRVKRKRPRMERSKSPMFSRFSVKYFSSVVKALTPHQRAVIEKYGLGCLLKFDKCEIPSRFVKWIACHFDTHCSDIKLNKRLISITTKSVNLVLGLPIGGKPLISDSEAGRDFLLSHFHLSKMPRIAFFGDKLKSNELLSDEDNFICFMIVACASFLCPSSNIHPSFKYLSAFKDCDAVKNFDLAKYVYDWFIASVKDFKTARKCGKKQKTPGGCSYVPVVVYLDHLDFGIHSIKEGFPRIDYWKGNMINFFSALDQNPNNSRTYGWRPIKEPSAICYYQAQVSTEKCSATKCADVDDFCAAFMHNLEISFGMHLPSEVLLDILKLLEKHNADKSQNNEDSSRHLILNVLHLLSKTGCMRRNANVDGLVDSDSKLSPQLNAGNLGDNYQTNIHAKFDNFVPKRSYTPTQKLTSSEEGSKNNASVGNDNDKIPSVNGDTGKLNKSLICEQSSKLATEAYLKSIDDANFGEATNALNDVEKESFCAPLVRNAATVAIISKKPIVANGNVLQPVAMGDSSVVAGVMRKLCKQGSSDCVITKVMDSSSPDCAITKVMDSSTAKSAGPIKKHKTKFVDLESPKQAMNYWNVSPNFNILGDDVQDNKKTPKHTILDQPLQGNSFAMNKMSPIVPVRLSQVFREQMCVIQCSQYDSQVHPQGFQPPNAESVMVNLDDYQNPKDRENKCNYNLSPIAPLGDVSTALEVNNANVCPNVQFVSETKFHDKCNQLSDQTEKIYNKMVIGSQQNVSSAPPQKLPTVLSNNMPSSSGGKPMIHGQRFASTVKHTSNPSIPQMSRFPVSALERRHYIAMCNLGQHKSWEKLEAIRLDKVYCSYWSLGTLRLNGHIDNFLIICYCRKLFEDCHPAISKKHYFFSYIGESILNVNDDNKGLIQTAFDGAIRALKMWNADLLFFPICHGHHWFLFVVCLKCRIFAFLDSLYSEDSDYRLDIKTVLINNFIHLWEELVTPRMSYRISFNKFGIFYPIVPKQTNRHDCGVFMMKFMELWHPRVQLTSAFSSADIPNIRVKYANQLYFSDSNSIEKSVVTNFFGHAEFPSTWE